MSSNGPTPVRGQLRRADKVMSADEAGSFLRRAFCGRTATVGDDGFPYVVPNLFVWHEGAVWLHTARYPGHFLRNIRHDDRVCFEVDEPGEIFPYGFIECDTSVSFQSVVVFGRIKVVSDPSAARRFFELFMEKYAPSDSWGREKGSFPRIEATYVYQITPESITGKAGVLPAVEERWPAKNNTLSPQWGKCDSAQGPETVLLTPADETGKPIEVTE
jgi:nitroimidazol reductase NimA-like FMN-containing flavoprotein (pyridoxamine 5'-phosphate oxidase superfamily)